MQLPFVLFAEGYPPSLITSLYCIQLSTCSDRLYPIPILYQQIIIHTNLISVRHLLFSYIIHWHLLGMMSSVFIQPNLSSIIDDRECYPIILKVLKMIFRKCKKNVKHTGLEHQQTSRTWTLIAICKLKLKFDD